jgi:hypothetical protein
MGEPHVGHGELCACDSLDTIRLDAATCSLDSVLRGERFSQEAESLRCVLLSMLAAQLSMRCGVPGDLVLPPTFMLLNAEDH